MLTPRSAVQMGKYMSFPRRPSASATRRSQVPPRSTVGPVGLGAIVTIEHHPGMLVYPRRKRRATDRPATPNRNLGMARPARRPRTADGDLSGLLRNVPLPRYGGPAQAEGPERAGKGAETTQPASRMNRPARTLTWDLVRRRHPTGASPSRRNAPGRTLSPMPSEQKGAYGGHLALVCRWSASQRCSTIARLFGERGRLRCAALVRRKALDFSTGPLRAEKSLPRHPLDVVCDRGVVTIQAPSEFPDADPGILRHLVEDRFLERAQGHVAPE